MFGRITLSGLVRLIKKLSDSLTTPLSGCAAVQGMVSLGVWWFDGSSTGVIR